MHKRLHNRRCDTVPAPGALLGHGPQYVLMVTAALKLIHSVFDLLYFQSLSEEYTSPITQS